MGSCRHFSTPYPELRLRLKTTGDSNVKPIVFRFLGLLGFLGILGLWKPILCLLALLSLFSLLGAPEFANKSAH